MSEPFAPEEVVLDDGTQLLIRAIRPDDAARLHAFAARLSPETIYRRFRAPRRSLPDAEAARLAEVDYARRMALVATLEPQGRDDIVGVARYEVPAAPAAPPVPVAGTADTTGSAGAAGGAAEVAVVVEDAYQGRGLGRHLIWRLAAYARGRGIGDLAALVAPNNEGVLRLLQHAPAPAETQILGYGEKLLRFPLRKG